jgi:hypothetical protein
LEETLQFRHYCNNNVSSVNVIIRLMLSDLVWPKVITLSGAYCIISLKKIFQWCGQAWCGHRSSTLKLNCFTHRRGDWQTGTFSIGWLVSKPDCKIFCRFSKKNYSYNYEKKLFYKNVSKLLLKTEERHSIIIFKAYNIPWNLLNLFSSTVF